jgi:hypothetical protein
MRARRDHSLLGSRKRLERFGWQSFEGAGTGGASVKLGRTSAISHSALDSAASGTALGTERGQHRLSRSCPRCACVLRANPYRLTCCSARSHCPSGQMLRGRLAIGPGGSRSRAALRLTAGAQRVTSSVEQESGVGCLSFRKHPPPDLGTRAVPQKPIISCVPFLAPLPTCQNQASTGRQQARRQTERESAWPKTASRRW